MPITAEEFRAATARRRKVEDVEVEDFGIVRLRSLSAGQQVAFQHLVKQARIAGEDPEMLGFTALAWSWVDDAGEPLFSEEEAVAQAKALDDKAYAKLVKRVFALNGIGEDAVEDAGKN